VVWIDVASMSVKIQVFGSGKLGDAIGSNGAIFSPNFYYIKQLLNSNNNNMGIIIGGGIYYFFIFI